MIMRPIDTTAFAKKGGQYEATHSLACRRSFCCITGWSCHEAKKRQADHRGRGHSKAARQPQTRPQGRTSAGAAKLVAAILFRHESRPDEGSEEKEVIV